jgi:p-aminobenzoyl-glutamate transporter AbgT
MEEGSLIDSELHITDIKSKLKSDRKKYILIILVLTAFNIVMYGLLMKSSRSTAENFEAAISSAPGFIIIGFVLGTITAIFPYKGLSYDKKYLRASLLTTIALKVIFAAMLMLLGIFTLFGWY